MNSRRKRDRRNQRGGKACGDWGMGSVILGGVGGCRQLRGRGDDDIELIIPGFKAGMVLVSDQCQYNL